MGRTFWLFYTVGRQFLVPCHQNGSILLFLHCTHSSVPHHSSSTCMRCLVNRMEMRNVCHKEWRKWTPSLTQIQKPPGQPLLLLWTQQDSLCRTRLSLVGRNRKVKVTRVDIKFMVFKFPKTKDSVGGCLECHPWAINCDMNCAEEVLYF